MRIGKRWSSTKATGCVRWSYAELSEHAHAVARSLLALGAVKGTRVGIMMTNRPEFLAAIFGVGLMGGIAVDAQHLLDVRGARISARKVRRVDAAVRTVGAEEGFRGHADRARAAARHRAASGGAIRTAFPICAMLAVVGEPSDGSAIESWPQFLARGNAVAAGAGRCLQRDASRPAMRAPSSSRPASTGRPKGILSAHRGHGAAVRAAGLAVRVWATDVRTWTANGFFWSGNFAHGDGHHACRAAARWSCSDLSTPDEALDADRARKGQLTASPGRINGPSFEAPQLGRAPICRALRYVDGQSRSRSIRRSRPTGASPTAATATPRPSRSAPAIPRDTPVSIAGDNSRPAAAGQHAQDRRSADRRDRCRAASAARSRSRGRR